MNGHKGVLTSDLNDEELRRVAAAETQVASELDLRRGLSLDNLAEEWAGICADVAEGYSLTVDDYMNDLTTRDLIASIFSHLRAELSYKLKRKVAPADEQFRRATTHVEHALNELYSYWWWYRIPLKLQGDLRDDLASMGYPVP